MLPGQTEPVAPESGASEKLYWPGDQWESVAAAQAGMDGKKLDAAAKYALSRHSTSFLVLRHGRILLEVYGEGGGPKVSRKIASATKSMTSILVGMALDAGKFEGLDQTVAEFLPSWRDTPKAKITLLHLLAMSSGLDPKSLPRGWLQTDQFTHNATMTLTAAPGTVWSYNTSAYHMLFRLLEKSTGQSLEEWSAERLFGPLGMEHAGWNKRPSPDGVINYFNVACSARDLARFGLFVLRGGTWHGKRLISSDFFKAATSSSQEMNPAYGYLFWLNARKGHAAGGGKVDYRFKGAPRDLIACLGKNGQHIISIPSQDLVIVRQGESPRDPEFNVRYVRLVLSAIEGRSFVAEPASGLGAQRSRIFARLDKDGDGRLSATEFGASTLGRKQPEIFARIDADGDGYLSSEEIATLRR